MEVGTGFPQTLIEFLCVVLKQLGLTFRAYQKLTSFGLNAFEVSHAFEQNVLGAVVFLDYHLLFVWSLAE